MGCDSSTQPPPQPLTKSSSVEKLHPGPSDEETSHHQQHQHQKEQEKQNQQQQKQQPQKQQNQQQQVINPASSFNPGSIDHSVYHIVPSSASSASSSAISSYTLPPHMQYYHSHHYLSTSNSPPATVDYSNYTNDTQGDLASVPEPSYSALSEKLRKSTPNEFQCSLFCGGKRCKYESGKKWKDDEKAIPGIYSHWVTDDIVAMSRPNTETIEKCNLVQFFQSQNIKTIINLQEPGEHANCGNGLHSSGFSYDPQVFMKNGIYFFNFKWKDYTAGDVNCLLDMVKVMAFSITEGRVAVHCHAGLGRTGVLISCYLIFAFRCKAREAISFVRSKRPYSVQMKSQIESVYAFAQFLQPLMAIFPTLSNSNSNMGKNHHNRYIVTKQMVFTLNSVIKRQQILLHGYEARHLKFIPKILFSLCERLLQLCNKHRTPTQGLKWHLVTSMSQALNELSYPRSRDSYCGSSNSSTSSSFITSPVTTLIDFQLTESSESFTRHFFSSVPNNLIDPNVQNNHHHHQNQLNHNRTSSTTATISSVASFNSSSSQLETAATTNSVNSSACSSNYSFTATEPAITEEVDEEDTSEHIINAQVDFASKRPLRRSSLGSSSGSLNNYTGESPASDSPPFGHSPTSESNYTYTHNEHHDHHDHQEDFYRLPSNKMHSSKIHSNSVPSALNCNESMPPVEETLFTTTGGSQKMSKIVITSKDERRVNEASTGVSGGHEEHENRHKQQQHQQHQQDNSMNQEEMPSPSESLSGFLQMTLGYKMVHMGGDSLILSSEGRLGGGVLGAGGGTGGVGVAGQLMSSLEGDKVASDRPETYAKVKELLAKASQLIDPAELERDELEGRSPSGESVGSRETLAQEYSEILREYEKEACVGMVDSNFVIDCLLKDHLDMGRDFSMALSNYQKQLNDDPDSWDKVSREVDLRLLSGLFWSWLEGLNEPILNKKSLIYVVLKAERPLEGLAKLDKETRFSLEYLIRFMARLQSEDYEGKELLNKKLLATLTHQSIKLSQSSNAQQQQQQQQQQQSPSSSSSSTMATTEAATADEKEPVAVSNVIPANRSWPEMRRGTNGRIELFLKNLYSLIQC